jgi:Rod binding domain-containing protein
MNVETTFVNPTQFNNSKLEQLKQVSVQDERLKEVCNEFESFFTQQFLEASLKSTNIAGEGTGSDIIKGMYTQAVAQSSAGTFGISDMLYQFLSENNK